MWAGKRRPRAREHHVWKAFRERAQAQWDHHGSEPQPQNKSNMGRMAVPNRQTTIATVGGRKEMLALLQCRLPVGPELIQDDGKYARTCNAASPRPHRHQAA
jgi:hypothetical protein